MEKLIRLRERDRDRERPNENERNRVGERFPLRSAGNIIINFPCIFIPCALLRLNMLIMAGVEIPGRAEELA